MYWILWPLHFGWCSYSVCPLCTTFEVHIQFKFSMITKLYVVVPIVENLIHSLCTNEWCVYKHNANENLRMMKLIYKLGIEHTIEINIIYIFLMKQTLPLQIVGSVTFDKQTENDYNDNYFTSMLELTLYRCIFYSHFRAALFDKPEVIELLMKQVCLSLHEY